MKRRLIWLTSLSLLLAACGSGASHNLVIASSPEGIGVGSQRIVVGVTDLSSGEFAADPSIEVTATLRDETGSPVDTSAGEFVWAVPETVGVYVFHVDFPEVGTHQLEVSSDEWGTLGPVGVVSLVDPTVVAVGDQAPLSETRTTADHAIAQITSDPAPDPAFYEMSVAEAIEAGPAAIVFSSFVDCSGDGCGTLLEQVKTLSADYEAIEFVHVDVYHDVINGGDLVPAVSEWGLPSEPWVFVVDDSGAVVSRLEGAATDRELQSSFALVAP